MRNSVKVLSEAEVHPWASKALFDPVSARHRSQLKEFQAAITDAWLQVSLVSCLVEFFQAKFNRGTWQPQTLFREMCATTGAFSKLPLYSNFPFPVLLNDDPIWSAVMKRVQMAAAVSQPHHQLACDRETMLKAVASEWSERPSIAMALLLQWVTSARVGCVLKLRRSCLHLSEDGTLSVQFRDGKGVQFRSLYTVHSYLPPEHASRLRSYLQGMDAEALLVPRTTGRYDRRHNQMVAALRKVKPGMTMRAVRRGSLQTMATNGASMETLMQFSGHTTERSTKRYLDWGRLFGAGQAEAREAAQTLFATSQ